MARYDLSDPDAVSFCRTCGTGYRAGPLHCADCGELLVSRGAIAAESPSPSGSIRLEPAAELDDSWVVLGDVANPFLADVLTIALEDAGIDFVARPWGYFETAGRGALRFLVQPGDHDRASGILEELEALEQAPLEEGPEWEVEAVAPERSDDEARERRAAFDLADSSAVCFCPGCGAGYRAGFSRCADCDEALVSREQARKWAGEPE